MDLISQSALIVAVVGVSLGASVFARNIRNKLFISFATLCVTISAWALAFFLYRVLGDVIFYRAHLFLNVWLAPIGLGFVRSMVRVYDSFSRRLFALSLLVALTLSSGVFFGWDREIPILVFVYFAPVLVLFQILQLMQIDRRLKQGLKLRPKTPTVGLSSRRRVWIYFGGIVVLATSTMDHFPVMGRIIPSLGNIALSVYLYFLSQAITQQRLLNFSSIFYRFLVLSTVALILAGIYSIVFVWVQDSPALFFLNSFVFAFLLVMLLDPLRSLMRYLTHRLVSHEVQGIDQSVRKAQREIATLVQPDALFDAIVRHTKSFFNPERTALFVLNSRGTHFQRVRFAEKTQITSAEDEYRSMSSEMTVDHALLRRCQLLKRRGDLPVLLEQVIETDAERSASRNERESLSELRESLRAYRCNLLIPFFNGDQVLGLVLMHMPVPPASWGDNWGWLHLVYPYFRHVSRTLKSMEVYTRQREKDRLAELGQMAAGLAHEIRNPLVAIKGAAQFLGSSPERKDLPFLQIITEEADRLNQVVTDFLDYSKPQNQPKQVFDLVELARKTVDLVQKGEGTQFEIRVVADKNPVQISGVPQQIHQLLLNLLKNSIRVLGEKSFPPEQRGKIRVSVKEGPQSVILEVEDNGLGISPEFLDRLFLPFFTTSEQGTGLGLSISQKIAEAHEGRIEVSSEEGRYTRFSVFFPKVELEQTDLVSLPVNHSKESELTP